MIPSKNNEYWTLFLERVFSAAYTAVNFAKESIKANKNSCFLSCLRGSAGGITILPCIIISVYYTVMNIDLDEQFFA